MTVLPMSLWDEVRVRKQSERYRGVKLTANGAVVGWLQRRGYLLVELPRRMQRDETVTLDLVAEVELLSRTPESYEHWRLIGGWYPTPEPFGRELAEIRLSATLNSPLVPLAGGEVQERASINGVNSIRTRLAGPMRTGVVVGGRYSTVTKELDGRRVHVSTLQDRPVEEVRADAMQLATNAIGVRDCLERWLGVPYPFPDLQVIETGYGLDQAPGVIFVRRSDFRPVHGLGETGTTHRIAREVAHAWFPHVAKVLSREEGWLGESLADYTSAYCLAQLGMQELFKARVSEWKSASKRVGDDASVLLADHLGYSDKDRWARANLLQGRGPLVLHGVHERLIERYGEEKGTNVFLTWIRSYVKNFTYKPAHTRGLVAILEQITGESWQAYFEQYLFGTDPAPVK
jgi:hypothetical protein